MMASKNTDKGTMEMKKRVAHDLLSIFGGTPKVQEYIHDVDSTSIDILSCQGVPDDEVISFATIGLCDHAMIYQKREFPTRIEIVSCFPSDIEFAPNLIASIAFTILKSDELYHPGSCLPNQVLEYYKGSTVPHVILVDPFLWANSDFPELKIDQLRVNFLQVVPISGGEFEYLNKNGEDALTELMQEREINVFDLFRKSAI